MSKHRDTSSATFRIVGINDNTDLPILITGLELHLKRNGAGSDPGEIRPPETTGANGMARFKGLVAGVYDLTIGSEDVPLWHGTIQAGCDVQLPDITVPVSLQVFLGGVLLRRDDPLAHGRNLRLTVRWEHGQHEERLFGGPKLSDVTAELKVSGAQLRFLGAGPDRSAGAGTPAYESVATSPAFVAAYTLYAQALQLKAWGTIGLPPGPPAGAAGDPPDATFQVENAEPQPIEGNVNVSNRRVASRVTGQLVLGIGIRKSTEALSFDRYYDFMNWIFCPDDRDPKAPPPARKSKLKDMLSKANQHRFLPFTDTDSYRNIKVATEAFVMANCGVFSDFDEGDADYVQSQVVLPTPVSADALENRLHEYLQSVEVRDVPELLPYLAIIRRKLIDEQIKDKDIGDVVLGSDQRDARSCYGLLRRKLTCPCLFELIWSYWQEEGMLVQTMNSLTRRFQNMRAPGSNDPLANLEIDPLRPLNNVIWGYIQDEQHRLSVVRRNYEYDHHYGLRLAGRAVRDVRTADSRSKFLEAFHTLLSITSAFYKRDDDTTIVADGFPVLNALKEAHLILSQGAHNQFGDLPSTARIEMLMQQWILSRPEFREFLPTRIMVAYPEPWMDRVDAMKKLQGWTDTSVLHFRNLAIFGEQVLLAIRYGDWADINDPAEATNWARYWRPEIQGYMHAYRSVTGVDLSVDVTNARIDATLPSVHLVQRLSDQRRVAR